MRAALFSFVIGLASLSATSLVGADAAAEGARLTAQQVVERALDNDAWGRDGISATARVIVTEKNGQKRELAFEAESRRYAPPLAKSMLRFSAPADVAGMKFLLVQKDAGDDERTVYMPDLKRSRRVPAANRSEQFMGTDFTYADMDRKDVRNGTPMLAPEENIGKYPCYHVRIATTEASASYKRVEIWVRKDNLVPLKWVMFDNADAPMKTLVSKELQRHNGRWQITRSQMVDHRSGRNTEILLDHIESRQVPLETFTVANLEKT
jgi:hypothetical protein